MISGLLLSQTLNSLKSSLLLWSISQFENASSTILLTVDSVFFLICSVACSDMLVLSRRVVAGVSREKSIIDNSCGETALSP